MTRSFEDQRARLLSSRGAEFTQVLEEALSGEAGVDPELLVDAVWDLLAGERRTEAVAALRAVRRPSPVGASVLRRALTATGRGSQDLRCVAALGLGLREGVDSTPALVAAFTATRSNDLRGYLLAILAYTGDACGWEPVHEWLGRELTRAARPGSWPPLAALGFTYLARQAGLDAHRGQRLVELAVRSWPVLDRDERAWVRTYWPELAGEGAAGAVVRPPDPEALTAWVRALPLFATP